PQSSGFITDDDIEQAKAVGEDWFIYEATLDHKKVGKCPFHADNKPSLILQKSKRTGYLYLKCFPCTKSWNSISFVMEQN
ncbi:CHC2 zinc finger domain-containing protein, partial [Legionella pneumophila]|uniref:CHC2 zinc finger domain-containing protein n=1 Tax=Legionella pneumophila TaxID=446 RepID=UPI00399D2B45